jgi:hypothetical protein
MPGIADLPLMCTESALSDCNNLADRSPTSYARRYMLFLIVGALIVVVAVLAYQLYQDRKEPKGTQINIGPSGITIEKK